LRRPGVEYVDRRSGGESMLSLGCVDTSAEMSKWPAKRWCRAGSVLSWIY
jgi:hypothetical protein